MKKWIESNATLQLRKGHHFYLYGCIHLIAVFQWELLCSWLPVRVRIKRPFCLFTTNDAGYRYFLNLSTLHSLTVITIYFLSRLCRTCFCIDSAKKNKKKRKEKNRFCMLVLVSNIAVCFYLVSAPFFIVVSEELS